MTDQRLVENAIRELVLANRILAREDVIDDFGHVSVRHPTNPDRFLLSRSRSPEVVTRDDIMEFELDGTLVSDDNRRPYAERFIHGAIYMARPDVNSVSHHHARSVIPFSITDMPLRPVFHMASVMGPDVPVWDSQPEFGDTNMLVDSLEMGHSLAKALGGGRAALLRGHGAICAAPDLKAICMISVYMKDNAELILKTLPLGQPKFLSPGEIEKAGSMLLSDMPLARAWDYWTARAGFSGI
ncbi:class II aldolase/adducin family protein [Roseibium aggregatum]|uniref:Class II aldolase/adducin family protein n=1 Tax=Roseibium aggregatum TaxID=187304 RepID=A0A926P052_9HYPH|nr:class II aldolase/adducin family protein [Roseibium aggregatum]MBD1549619.1 class II aldolase/adducin family protein [Roseibium aggregatum]